MQVQEESGRYREPEVLDKDLNGREKALARKLQEALNDKNVRRVLIFPAYDEDGKPTPEMRRAWRRWNRTKE